MVNRTIITAMSVYMEMVRERGLLYEDETVEMVLENIMWQSGNSGNSILALHYLNKNANNQGSVIYY